LDLSWTQPSNPLQPLPNYGRNCVSCRGYLAISGNNMERHSPTNQMGQAIFRIPEFIQKQTLPSPTLSIREMLQFTLPRYSASRLDVSAFFCKELPGPITEITISSLRRLPVPPVMVVRKLENIGRQAWLNGYQSIMYAHLDKSVQTHYPLWVLTFWGEVVRHQTMVREPWLKCSDWLRTQTKQKKSMTLKRLAEDASVILTDLPWGSNKRGLSASEPILQCTDTWGQHGPQSHSRMICLSSFVGILHPIQTSFEAL
jgi:hypothetical protein